MPADPPDALREAVRDAAQALPVRTVWVFGSVARGEAGVRSDVDLAVLPADGVTDRMALRRDLQSAVMRRGFPDVDVVLVDEAPLRLQARIAAEGRVLVSYDEPARLAWTSRIFRQHADFALLQDRLDRKMLHAHANGRR